MTEPGRVYGGRSEPERRADRRARLLTAAFELFGTEGWASTTIERICSTAGVATRSFYEEFASREAALLAVYHEIMSGVIAEVVPKVTALRGRGVEQVRAGLTGYVSYVTDDPRRARVAHHEVRLAGGLEHQRRATMRRFADLIAQQGRLPEPDGHILGLALAGAVSEVLVDWVAQPEPRPETGPMVDVLVQLYARAIPAR
jgi:AcrR family transcriptional regulator